MATGGTYYNASTEQDLQRISEHISTRLVFTKQESEVTAEFTGVAGLLLLISGAFWLRWFNQLP